MKILNDILEDIQILDIKGNIDSPVSSISLNSKKIEPNSLFVAISGNVTDGHNFIEDVIKSGATTIIYEKDLLKYENGITYIKVSDTHDAVGIIANNFYNHPSRLLKLVGVTGTNGKTTTATLLHKLFRNLGYKAGMIGTIVNKINDIEFEASRTTPDAVSLNKLLREMVDDGCEYCFMEVSSHSVSEKRLSGISFVGGIFTNLTLDHLDYHKTIENYAEAKKGFFDMLPATGFAIANMDDPKGEYMLSTTKAKKYGLGLKDAQVGLVASHKSDLCQYFNERLDTKLLGEFNAYNILGIYAVAILLLTEGKLDLSEVEGIKNKVKEVIKDLDGAPGRFQSIKSENSVVGIVDYAHTPDALENVLKTVNEIRNQSQAMLRTGPKHCLGPRIITVVGCGGDRDKSKRPIMARIGYDMSDILILTSDNPRSEKPEDILNDMQKGLPLDHENKVEIIVDRHLAIHKACELAKPGDYILVAGKGHEKYQEVNGLRTYFDDMEELEKYLPARNA